MGRRVPAGGPGAPDHADGADPVRFPEFQRPAPGDDQSVLSGPLLRRAHHLSDLRRPLRPGGVALPVQPQERGDGSRPAHYPEGPVHHQRSLGPCHDADPLRRRRRSGDPHLLARRDFRAGGRAGDHPGRAGAELLLLRNRHRRGLRHRQSLRLRRLLLHLPLSGRHRRVDRLRTDDPVLLRRQHGL